MEPNFNVDAYVAQEQLFFGLDEVRGQYADAPNNDLYQQLQYGGQSYDQMSTSPDFILYQSHSQSIPLPSPEMNMPDLSQGWNISSAFSSPFHSFNGNDIHETTANTSALDYAAWNSPPMPQTSPPHSMSEPVPIPTRSFQKPYGVLSPTSTAYTSNFSQGSWNSSYTSTSLTGSMTESVASYDTATDEPIQFSKQPVSTSAETTDAPRLSMIQYSVSDTAPGLTQSIISGGKRQKGRTGPLNEAQRLSTALMRNVKACQSCRARKAKCDPGIPCRQCIKYYKNNLVHHPCREQRLEDIADKLLQGHVFPRKRALGKDFGANFRIWPNSDFTVYLSLGFGEPLAWPAQVVSPLNAGKYPKELVHFHVLYKCPRSHTHPAERAVEKQLVFPALLTGTSDLKFAVDDHLTKLIDNPANFTRFPVYASPLVVLKHIYNFYSQLAKSNEDIPAKKLLGQAFKLLNLIHIGGDSRVSPSASSRRILDHFFSIEVREQDVVPCYIRSQLGDVFNKLATEYMKDVLAQLELECLNRNCVRFPVIICTFIVLLMSIESLQHKTHKDTFHSVQDEVAVAASSSSGTDGTPGDEVDGMVDLLEFYKNCFRGCHRDRLLSSAQAQQKYWSHRNAGTPAFAAGENIISRLRDAIRNAEPYLRDRSKESLDKSHGDINVFFDRLVARLLLLEG